MAATTGIVATPPEGTPAEVTPQYVIENFAAVQKNIDDMKAEMVEMERRHEAEGMQQLADKYKQEALAKDLQLEIEKLKAEVKDKEKEKEKVKELQEEIEKKKEEGKGKGSEKKGDENELKGFTTKHSPKPDKYDMDPRGYQAWHDLFIAT